MTRTTEVLSALTLIQAAAAASRVDNIMAAEAAIDKAATDEATTENAMTANITEADAHVTTTAESRTALTPVQAAATAPS